MAGRTTPAEDLDASGLSFAIIWARFNHDITGALLVGARETLKANGAASITEFDVPGAFELPFVCRALVAPPPDPAGGALGLGSSRGRETSLDAVIALGCVIKGETPHFDFVAAECARGLMQVQLDTGVPIAFGVLTTDDEAQARARAGGEHGNKGADAAAAAIEMARLRREIRGAWEG